MEDEESAQGIGRCHDSHELNERLITRQRPGDTVTMEDVPLSVLRIRKERRIALQWDEETGISVFSRPIPGATDLPWFQRAPVENRQDALLPNQ
jgi:hypothetical protein